MSLVQAGEFRHYKIEELDDCSYRLENVYGNFDLILDHCTRIFWLHATPHALYNMLYFVPMLIGC